MIMTEKEECKSMMKFMQRFMIFFYKIVDLFILYSAYLKKILLYIKHYASLGSTKRKRQLSPSGSSHHLIGEESI